MRDLELGAGRTLASCVATEDLSELLDTLAQLIVLVKVAKGHPDAHQKVFHSFPSMHRRYCFEGLQGL